MSNIWGLLRRLYLPTLKLDVIHGRSQKQILNCFGIFLIKIEAKKAGKAKDQEFPNKLLQCKCKIDLFFIILSLYFHL